MDFVSMLCCFFFFKQKTAYEMRISDWSSDVCSSDLAEGALVEETPYSDQPYVTTRGFFQSGEANRLLDTEIPLACPVRLLHGEEIGRASCRERGCQYV